MLVSPKKKENRDTARQAKAFEGTKGRDSIPGKEVYSYVCVSLYTNTYTTYILYIHIYHIYIYIYTCMSYAQKGDSDRSRNRKTFLVA